MRRLFPIFYLPREKTFSLTDPGLIFVQSRAAVDKLQRFISGGSLFLSPLYDGDAERVDSVDTLRCHFYSFILFYVRCLHGDHTPN